MVKPLGSWKLKGGIVTNPLKNPDRLWSKEAEAAVLGSMMIDQKCIPEVLAIIIRTDMFFDMAHRYIFDAIVLLHIKQKPTEAVLLRTELKRTKKLDEVGGVEYIAAILDSVPSSANALYYAKIVRDRYNYRTMLKIVHEIADIPNEPGDVNEQIAKIQQLALSMEQEKEAKAHSFKDEIAESVMALADQRHHITSGFRALDKIIGGFYNFEFVIIAGRPGHGKSVLIGDVAVHLAKEGKRVIIFSMEMSAEAIMQRAVCAAASVDGNKWNNAPPQEEFDKAIKTAGELSELNITIYENVETARKMYAIVSAAQRTGPVDMIAVDNVQLMRTDPDIPKEYERLTSISRNLKKITQVLKVPVLCVSHLNREVEKRTNHRPKLSDLRGSGSIEQDADVVLLLHREDQYRKQSDPDIDPNEFSGTAEVIVAKNRRGRTGIAKLVFLEEYTTFANLAPEYLGE